MPSCARAGFCSLADFLTEMPGKWNLGKMTGRKAMRLWRNSVTLHSFASAAGLTPFDEPTILCLKRRLCWFSVARGSREAGLRAFLRHSAVRKAFFRAAGQRIFQRCSRDHSSPTVCQQAATRRPAPHCPAVSYPTSLSVASSTLTTLAELVCQQTGL